MVIKIIFSGLTKRKGRDMNVIEKLIKLDQESNKRFEEQTKKWLEMEEKREETRTIREEQHEEWMLSMFSSVMNRMVMATQQGPSPYGCYPVHPYSTYPTDMNYTTGDGHVFF